MTIKLLVTYHATRKDINHPDVDRDLDAIDSRALGVQQRGKT
jgi:hypothetical protein